MKTLTKLCVAVAAAGMAFSASAVPILVGEWDSGSSGDAEEIRDAQLAIEAYNAANDPDLPNLAVLPLPADVNDTEAALDVFVAKTTSVSGFQQGGDDKTIEWTAPGDYAFYYVLTKWGQGQADFDTALHYVLAGETLIYNPDDPAHSPHPQGLSHVAIWAGDGTTRVPDGGMTLLLLGAGIAALGGARRFIKA